MTTTEQQKRLRPSIFFVTVNSNKKNLDIKQQKTFYKQVCQLLIDLPKEYIKFKEPAHTYSEQYIKSISIGPGVLEIGKVNNYTHVHCIVSVKHYSKIQIDCAKLTKMINDISGYSCYCNSTWVKYENKKQDLNNVLDYMKKGLNNPIEKVKTIKISKNNLDLDDNIADEKEPLSKKQKPNISDNEN